MLKQNCRHIQVTKYQRIHFVNEIAVSLFNAPEISSFHHDVVKWKHFPLYWPFVRGIHRSQVNSPHKGQWCWALTFSLIFAWSNGWVNNTEDGDLRRHHAHDDVIVMSMVKSVIYCTDKANCHMINKKNVSSETTYVFNLCQASSNL